MGVTSEVCVLLRFHMRKSWLFGLFFFQMDQIHVNVASFCGRSFNWYFHLYIYIDSLLPFISCTFKSNLLLSSSPHFFFPYIHSRIHRNIYFNSWIWIHDTENVKRATRTGFHRHAMCVCVSGVFDFAWKLNDFPIYFYPAKGDFSL